MPKVKGPINDMILPIYLLNLIYSRNDDKENACNTFGNELCPSKHKFFNIIIIFFMKFPFTVYIGNFGK